MRLLVPFVLLLVLMTNLAHAQQGRHELPIDTISIGGKEQDMKMTHLEGYDDLLTQLTQVRDSIASVAGIHNKDSVSRNDPGNNAESIDASSNYLTRLDELIREMEKTKSDENLMRQGYSLLDRIRQNNSTH